LHRNCRYIFAAALCSQLREVILPADLAKEKHSYCAIGAFSNPNSALLDSWLAVG
jgi:hypothetical protein